MPSTADYQAFALQAAQAAGIDPGIFLAQITQESAWDPNARSSAGAQGIAQMMPATAAGLGINPLDPFVALQAAAQLDASYLARYGDVRLMLAAYNAGPGNVDKFGGVPPFEETQRYVARIMGNAPSALASMGSLSPVLGATPAVPSGVALAPAPALLLAIAVVALLLLNS